MSITSTFPAREPVGAMVEAEPIQNHFNKESHLNASIEKDSHCLS